jgi:carbonic anhydrase
MVLSRLALVSFLLAAPGAYAATGAAFSYDPDVENGPSQWGALEIDGNACDGEKNSPIAVATGTCDRYEDYKMDVSEYVYLFPL